MVIQFLSGTPLPFFATLSFTYIHNTSKLIFSINLMYSCNSPNVQWCMCNCRFSYLFGLTLSFFSIYRWAQAEISRVAFLVVFTRTFILFNPAVIRSLSCVLSDAHPAADHSYTRYIRNTDYLTRLKNWICSTTPSSVLPDANPHAKDFAVRQPGDAPLRRIPTALDRSVITLPVKDSWFIFSIDSFCTNSNVQRSRFPSQIPGYTRCCRCHLLPYWILCVCT